MTDSDGHNSSRDGPPVLDTASVSRFLRFRLEQLLLIHGLVVDDCPTTVYKCPAAQLDAASASSPQAAIATSIRVAAATCGEHQVAHINILIAQLRTLRKLVETVNAWLTVVETR